MIIYKNELTDHKFYDEIVLKIVGIKTYIYTYITAVLMLLICIVLYFTSKNTTMCVITYLTITLTALLVNHIAMSDYNVRFDRVKHALITGIYNTPLGGRIPFRLIERVAGRDYYDGKHIVQFSDGDILEYMYCYDLIPTYDMWCNLKKQNLFN